MTNLWHKSQFRYTKKPIYHFTSPQNSLAGIQVSMSYFRYAGAPSSWLAMSSILHRENINNEIYNLIKRKKILTTFLKFYILYWSAIYLSREWIYFANIYWYWIINKLVLCVAGQVRFSQRLQTAFFISITHRVSREGGRAKIAMMPGQTIPIYDTI